MKTQTLLAAVKTHRDPARDHISFTGGVSTDYATSRRIEGFRDVLTEAGLPPAPEQIIACGDPSRRTMQEIAALCDRLGNLPAGLLVNSLTTFEEVLAISSTCHRAVSTVLPLAIKTTILSPPICNFPFLCRAKTSTA